MNKKKVVLLPLASFLILGLVSCVNNTSSASNASTGTSAKTETTSTSESASKSSDQSVSTSSSTSSSSSETTSASTSSSSEEPIKEQTIGDINKAGTYDVKGVVVAKNTKSFVLHDGKDGILVFLKAVPTQNIGDVVEISDTIVDGTYMPNNGCYQFTNTAKITTATGMYAAPKATELTPTIVDGWKAASKASGLCYSTTEVKPYKWVGTAGMAGSYATTNLDGSTVNIEPAYLDSAAIPLVTGSRYEFEGYFIGYSNKYSYASVMLTKAAKLPSKPTSITITPSATSVTAGETVTLAAAVTPADAIQSVVWSVANKDSTVTDTLATISENTLTTIKAGVVTVTATSTVLDTITATVDITINAPLPNPTALTLSGYTEKVAVGGTTTIKVGYTPAECKTGVTFTSSDETVLTVTDQGVVKGIKLGTATVTVTSTQDTTVKATVTFSVLTPKSVAANNLLSDKAASDAVTLTGVRAETAYDATVKGFIGSTENGIVYVFDNATTKYTTGVVVGHYYNLVGTVTIYRGTYELKVTACTENTTVTDYAWTYETSMVIDLGTDDGIAAATTLLQGLAGKTDAQVATGMCAVTIKNAYWGAITNGYSMPQAAKGTNWSCLSAATGTHTVQFGYYAAALPTSYIDADTKVNYTGFFYATSYAFSTYATNNIICRLAGGTFVAA
jgi:hypothetical protein